MFEKNFQSFIDNIHDRLDPPSLHKEYIFFDFIELYALFFKTELTNSEINDFFIDKQKNILSYFPIFLEFNDDDIDENTNNDEKNNAKELVVNFLFECLDHRKKLLGDKYPFITTNNSLSLKKNLTTVQKIYLAMLFSSMLKIFKEFNATLTTDFESITYCSLVELFPNYIIKEFGKNTEYTGNAREKIKKLAIDLNILTDENEIRTIHYKNTQEKGLDLILWKPFNDKIPNMPIYLAQCACGKDWTKKFSEVKRYLCYLNFKKPDPRLIFSTPYALNCNNTFYQNDDVISSESIFLDRFRILEYLNNEPILEEKALESLKLVSKLVEMESIIN